MVNLKPAAGVTVVRPWKLSSTLMRLLMEKKFASLSCERYWKRKWKETLKAKELAHAQDSESQPAPSSLLLQFGVDLTQRARDGKLDLVNECDEEIWNCLRILVRRRKKNACLVGEPGVGKSAIVEGIAQVLVSNECPPLLKGYRIVALEVGSLVARTKYRGEFEERLCTIIKAVTDVGAEPTILFLDEIHTHLWVPGLLKAAG